MRAGQFVELGPAEMILTAPEADYTRELLAAVPQIPHAIVLCDIFPHASVVPTAQHAQTCGEESSMAYYHLCLRRSRRRPFRRSAASWAFYSRRKLRLKTLSVNPVGCCHVLIATVLAFFHVVALNSHSIGAITLPSRWTRVRGPPNSRPNKNNNRSKSRKVSPDIVYALGSRLFSLWCLWCRRDVMRAYNLLAGAGATFSQLPWDCCPRSSCWNCQHPILLVTVFFLNP